METKPIEFNIDEARIIRAALISFSNNAPSDEPHYSNSPEFGPLLKKVHTLITDAEEAAHNSNV